MLLRRIFDAYESDEPSEYTLRHADLNGISRKRRENYLAVIEGLHDDLNGITVIFPQLPENTVPSHFVIYAEQRDALQSYLLENQIRSTVYWPVGPEINLSGHETARYIYEHILAIPCDQRYSPSDMRRVSDALNHFGESHE
jgi:dTDP-4-amino-4,6-dideoxygalactose transaminase